MRAKRFNMCKDMKDGRRAVAYGTILIVVTIMIRTRTRLKLGITEIFGFPDPPLNNPQKNSHQFERY